MLRLPYENIMHTKNSKQAIESAAVSGCTKISCVRKVGVTRIRKFSAYEIFQGKVKIYWKEDASMHSEIVSLIPRKIKEEKKRKQERLGSRIEQLKRAFWIYST